MNSILSLVVHCYNYTIRFNYTTIIVTININIKLNIIIFSQSPPQLPYSCCDAIILLSY